MARAYVAKQREQPVSDGRARAYLPFTDLRVAVANVLVCSLESVVLSFPRADTRRSRRSRSTEKRALHPFPHAVNSPPPPPRTLKISRYRASRMTGAHVESNLTSANSPPRPTPKFLEIREIIKVPLYSDSRSS